MKRLAMIMQTGEGDKWKLKCGSCSGIATFITIRGAGRKEATRIAQDMGWLVNDDGVFAICPICLLGEYDE